MAQTVVLLTGARIVAALGDLTHGSPTGTLIATTVLFGPVTMFLAAVSPYAVKLATRDSQLSWVAPPAISTHCRPRAVWSAR